MESPLSTAQAVAPATDRDWLGNMKHCGVLHNTLQSEGKESVSPTCLSLFSAFAGNRYARGQNTLNNTSNLTNTHSDTDPSQVKQEEVDALMARELNALSLNERSKIMEEIHGVEPNVQETRSFVLEKTIALVQAIEVIRDKPAFDAARGKSNYVTSEDFLLMFLRSESFNVLKTAQKIVNFMDEKRNLFGGGEVLGRPLRLTDLTLEERTALKSGFHQWHPSRDSAGRLIFLDFRMLMQKDKSYRNATIGTKLSFFLLTIAADDIETQRRGCVFILYYVGKFNGDFDIEMGARTSKNAAYVPLSLKCVHICLEDPILPFKALGTMILGESIRARLRIHQGSHTECQYELMTYGIPVESLPISADGEIKTTQFHQWIARRHIKDEVLRQSGQPFEGIDVYGCYDILFRRGQIYNQHPGNVRMRLMIEAERDAYDCEPAGSKTNISRKIVDRLQSEFGSRLLIYDANIEGGLGWWMEISLEDATRRVSKAFRSARAQARREQPQPVPAPAPVKIFSTAASTNDDREHKKPRITVGD